MLGSSSCSIDGAGLRRSAFWRERRSVCALRSGETRSAFWQCTREVVHKGGGRLRRPPPFVDSLMSCHNRDLVLPQQRSCLATTHILSCHNRDLVLPQHTSCLATTEILSCHNRDLVFPQQTQLLCVQHRQFWAKMSEISKIIKFDVRMVRIVK